MKVCVIGVGRMGRRHIAAALSMGFQVEGVFDPLQESIDLAIKEQNIIPEKCFRSVEEMLEKVRPEGLVVASTAPSHCEYVCLGASAGVKYILCEKPMAVSISQCTRMMEACRKSGTALAVNHQMRFMKHYAKLKEICASEKLGGLRSITIAGSNFGLAMNGSHYFEMFRFSTGSSVSEVSFTMGEEIVPNPRGVEFEDRSGQLLARNPEGQRLYMEIGGDQGHGIHIIYGCRYGQVFLDESTGFARASYRQEESRNLPTTRYGAPGEMEVFDLSPPDIIELTMNVWQALLSGRNYPDGECGRHTVQSLVAAQVSGESNGRKVSLKNLPEDRVFPWA
jgi:predicted dehydrogenase